MKKNIFASSGSCLNPIEYINGYVNGITFTSEKFSGTMNSQKFWDDLAKYAKDQKRFVYLVY